MASPVTRKTQLRSIYATPVRVSRPVGDSHTHTKRLKRSTQIRSPSKLEPLGSGTEARVELTPATRLKWFEEAEGAFVLSSVALQLTGDLSSHDSLDRQLEPISHQIAALKQELAHTALLREATRASAKSPTTTTQAIDERLTTETQQCWKQRSLWTRKKHPVADANPPRPLYAQPKLWDRLLRYKQRTSTRTAIDPILSSEVRSFKALARTRTLVWLNELTEHIHVCS